MNTVKDEYASHMYNIGETSLDFLSKSGMIGWPTILGILNIAAINPDSYQWMSKNNIEVLPKPELGDDVHWYKLKYDLKSNLRRSVPISLLKNVNMFTSKNIPDPISTSKAFFVSKGAVYFLQETDTKACFKTELDLRNCKTVDVKDIIDVMTNGSYDYILTQNAVYRINNSDFSGLTKILGDDRTGKLAAFCLANNVIIVASSTGGWRIADIEASVPPINKIERKTGTITIGTGDTSTIKTVDNGMPTGECKYCWFDGSKYYIGDYITSGHFTPNDEIYAAPTTDIAHPSYLHNGVNRHCNGVKFANIGGSLIYGSSTYFVSDVKSVLELDNVMIFGTGSGLRVFTKTPVDGNYGPTKEFIKLDGISEPVNGICILYGTIFVCGKNNKYRTFDSEEDENKFRIVVFGTNYDADIESKETDAKEVKVDLMEILDLGTASGKAFDKKFAKANSKPAQYAIITFDSKPKVFNLYGHDNRNSAAVELKGCMTSFDMEV